MIHRHQSIETSFKWSQAMLVGNVLGSTSLFRVLKAKNLSRKKQNKEAGEKGNLLQGFNTFTFLNCTHFRLVATSTSFVAAAPLSHASKISGVELPDQTTVYMKSRTFEETPSIPSTELVTKQN